MRALVRFDSREPKGTTWVCTISDFCAGGMLLIGNRRGLNEAFDGDGPERGTAIDVHFSARDKAGKQHSFHHRGEVARTVTDGLGVMFSKALPDAALDALSWEAGHASSDGVVANGPDEHRPLLKPDLRKQVIKSCARFTQRQLLIMVRNFTADFRDELINCHTRASTDQEREQFSSASMALRATEKEFIKRFVNRVVEPVIRGKPAARNGASDDQELPEATEQAPATRSKLFTNSRLSLVDKDDFEHWLVVADMVSSVESEVGEELFLVQHWLGMVSSDWRRKDANPVAPAAVIGSLEHAMGMLELSDVAARLAYEVFDTSCRKDLRNFYEQLVALLAELNVFPSIDEIINETIKNQSPGPKSAESRKRDEAPGKGSHASGSAANKLLEVANSLTASGAEAGGNTPEIDVNEVLQALSRLPKTIERLPGQEGSLKRAFLQQIGDDGAAENQVPKRVLNALDMVDHMMSSVDEDEALSKDLREWIRKLEVTLGKEAARSDEFLNSDPSAPHAALQMLNQLEGVDGDTIDMEKGKRASARVDAVLERLVADWEGNSDAFVDAVEELEPLVEQQKKLYSRNLERVVNGAEGRARLKRAKQIVLKCLAATFERRPMPEVVLEVVQPAWRNLLVNTALREGTQAVVWKQQLKVLRRLAEFLCMPAAGPAPASTVRVLVQCLADGFESIGQRPRPRLLDEVRDMLAHPQQRRLDEVPVLPEGAMAELLGWESLVQLDPLPPTNDPKARERYLEMMRRARVLRTGSRIKFEESEGEPRTATLAWAAPSGTDFVFVNRRGIWDRELSLGKLTEQLSAGEATVLDGYDVPLVERVSERMLSRIHGKITGEAQKDDLTDLANRRFYERSLEKLVALARHTETQHCALQIDLDQFKIVNSTCGYDGGDALLKELAGALRSELSAYESTVARIGADEFAAVLRNVTAEEGREIADRIVRRVRHMQFSWGTSHHTITTTIGVLGIDQSSDDGRSLLHNLSAACRAGKEQGGDCVYVYVEDDQAMLEQRAVMQRASKIEQQLADGRVLVNAQQIAPSQGDDQTTGHYEVLISVLDAEDQARSPVEFIEAAERFGKMPMVDRFVVSNVLRWMAEHANTVSLFGGFSINLSGQSIKQDDFLDFVLREFEQSGADASKVCFEVTETAAMGNLSRAAEFIQKLRVLGCSFSLDDFGTGMSSYAYLRELPVDYLKIDGSFVKNMATDPSDQAVVKSINEIGHFMGKKTVAEYVHDEATLAAARDIGVDFVQGWHIEKPRPIDSLVETYGEVARARSA